MKSNFSFSHSVFKKLMLQTRKYKGLFQRVKRYISDSSKLKVSADDNLEFDENGKKFSKWVENTVERGEIAISPLPTLFSIVLYCRHVNNKGLNMVGMMEFVIDSVENIENGESPCDQHFLLFPQGFQKTSNSGSFKVWIVYLRAKPLLLFCLCCCSELNFVDPWGLLNVPFSERLFSMKNIKVFLSYACHHHWHWLAKTF